MNSTNVTYAAQGFTDPKLPEVNKSIEKRLRRRLLEDLEEILFNGEMHVINISREEDIVPSDEIIRQPYGANVVRVTYRAEISRVEHKHFTVMEAWNEYNHCKKHKGRNHRKKDRAEARKKRAKRRKVAARLRA